MKTVKTKKTGSKTGQKTGKKTGKKTWNEKLNDAKDLPKVVKLNAEGAKNGAVKL